VTNDLKTNIISLNIITDQFSGPARAIGQVCVSVCIQTITIQRNENLYSRAKAGINKT